MFKILRNNTVKALHSIYQQIWRTQAWTTGLEKVSFHSNPKGGQCQRMIKLPHNHIHFMCSQGDAQNPSSWTSTSTWTKNFKLYKLDWEKAEEPEIELLTTFGSMKKQGNSRKKYQLCFIDYAKASDCVDHKKLWKSVKEMEIPDHLTCLPRTCMQIKEQ